MNEYKLYLLDDEGHIRQRIDIDCETDEAAIAAIEGHRDHRAVELWSGARFVIKFPKREV